MSKILIDPTTLASLRREAGLSQQAFAVAVDVSVSAVQRWESSTRGPAAMLPIVWRSVRLVLRLPDSAEYAPAAGGPDGA